LHESPIEDRMDKRPKKIAEPGQT